MTTRSKERQIRSVVSSLQTRDNEEAGEKKIAGYFVVFNSETELWPGAFEEILPEACQTIPDDVRALFDHDSSKVLGRTKAGTLTLKADSKGLFGEILINENDSDAVNLYERVKRGDIDQCSFGFRVLEEDTEWRDDGTVKWTIKEIELFEVSVVTFPAYEDTEVEARRKEVNGMNEKRRNERKQNIKERMKSWHLDNY
ncbi:HK97 family phage prohead protease [Enterococcus termitis]|uniref:Phage prohead protease n=1 Tax=Enterococcus termitis TaxID=332950 RepID=A0A1E5GV20_9ENTE|nr:HK97 family phage prohead protease [Enterococcus termitis]OEG16170.1 phage prohead protease [Enterococcus termitis]